MWLERDHEVGQRTYALRSAYNTLRATLPVEAIVQYNPNANALFPRALLRAQRGDGLAALRRQLRWN